MKKFIKKCIATLAIVTLLSNTVLAYEHSSHCTINSGSSVYTSTYTVNDTDKKWTVFTSSCTFSGMPVGQYPANFKLNFRPYANSTQAATNYVYCSKNGSNGVGIIGSTSVSASYASGYGGRGNSYRMKINANCSTTCYPYYQWTL